MQYENLRIFSVKSLKFYFLDRAQETLHYVLDICDGSTLFILDEENDEEEEVSTVQALISEVELQDEADEASKGAASREKKSSNSSTARYIFLQILSYDLTKKKFFSVQKDPIQIFHLVFLKRQQRVY